MKPFISILTPVYNQKGKMEKYIESLNNQTCKDFEVILVDDGSTDNSYEEFSRLDKSLSVKVFTHECNKSLVTARYTGMQQISGEYVLFLDSDDSLSINACEVLKNYLTKTPVDILRFAHTLGDGIVEPEEYDDLLTAMYDEKVTFAIWKNCYSKNVIKKSVEAITPFYANMGEDCFFSSVFYTFANKISLIKDVLYDYQLGTGMSSSHKGNFAKMKRDMESANAVRKNVTAFLKKYNPKYVEKSEKALKRVAEFVGFQNVRYEEDWHKVFELIDYFDNEEYKYIFDFVCKNALPAKIAARIGVKAKLNFD